MNPEFFIMPVAGGIIGYITNWLAIKMLFYPHETKYIGKFKLPFTPGLIPKEKLRISSILGATVENHLLTNDVILNELAKADVSKSLDKYSDDALSYLKNSTLSLDETLMKIFVLDDKITIDKKISELSQNISNVLFAEDLREKINETIYSKIKDFGGRQINTLPYEQFLSKIQSILNDQLNIEQSSACKIVEKTLWEFLISMKDNEKSLNQTLSYSTVQGLKDYISVKIPVFANYLISLTEKEEVEDFIKEKIAAIIKNTAKPLTRMFIDSEKIYVKAIEGLTKYFNDPMNLPEIEQTVEDFTDKILYITIGEVAHVLSSQLRENNVQKMVDFLLKESFEERFITAFFDNIKDFIGQRQSQSIGETLFKDKDQLEATMRDLSFAITSLIFSEGIYESLSSMVEDKIKSLRQVKISSLAEKVNEETLDRGKKLISHTYFEFVKRIAPNFLNSFDIAKIIEGRINSFSTAHTEELIINIAQKELTAITYVGGVLGFVIGLIPVLLKFI